MSCDVACVGPDDEVAGELAVELACEVASGVG